MNTNLKDTIPKWLFSFALLAACIYWGQFCVDTVKCALATKADADILAVAGVGGIAGSLMTLLTLTVQYWFRKKTADDKPTGSK